MTGTLLVERLVGCCMRSCSEEQYVQVSSVGGSLVGNQSHKRCLV